MTNQIFEISVRSFDKNYNKTRDRHRIYGKDTAIQYGMEFGICDNVSAVDVVDILTGEVMLTMEHGEVIWLVEDEEAPSPI